MRLQKGKKILIYFFLLLLFGSINNIGFSSLKFKKIEEIKVIGLGNEDNSILLQNIKNLNLDKIFFLNQKEIKDIISSNSLVEKYKIFKRYPSSLDINIEKTRFLARINNNGKIFLVGSNGKLSKKKFSDISLPFIFGKPDIEEFLNFKKIIDRSNFSYKKIKNLYFFPSKRWDLEFNNGMIIKLSKKYNETSLNLIFQFLQNKNFQNIKVVDARIKNQIILND